MGSSGSSGGGGRSLTGGKTVLAGTFLAEQTHPASYTLVSVAASSHRREGPRVQAVNRFDRGDRLRKSRAEKGGTQCTKLSALDAIDSLLLPNEDVVVPDSGQPKEALSSTHSSLKNKGFVRQGKKAMGGGASGSGEFQEPGSAKGSVRPDELPGQMDADDIRALLDAEAEVSAAPPAALPLQPTPPAAERLVPLKQSPRKILATGGSKTPLQKRGSPTASASLAEVSEEAATIEDFPVMDMSCSSSPSRPGQSSNRPPSQPATSSSDDSQVFGRLYIAQKPWVAGVTDSQLLQYLAWRGGTPEIAMSARSTSRSVDTSLYSTSRSHRRQYRSHRELFDNCLRREASPSPTRDGSRPDSQESEKGISPRSGSRPLYSPQRLAKAQVARAQSTKLIDQIEEIAVIPQDAVEAWMEAEKDLPFDAAPNSPTTRHGPTGFGHTGTKKHMSTRRSSRSSKRQDLPLRLRLGTT